MEKHQAVVLSSAGKIARASENEIYSALLSVANIIGGIKTNPYAQLALQEYVVTVDNLMDTICFPDYIHEYEEFKDCFQLDCKTCFKYLHKLMLACTPEETQLLRAGIMQGLGSNFLASDKDFEIKGEQKTENPKKKEAAPQKVNLRDD